MRSGHVEKYRRRVETVPGLYNSSDHVTLLSVNNFYQTLAGKEHAWLVQFYSAFCGHCIAFAPQFKIFVKNITDWSHSIKPAVLNCADPANTGLCRQYEVFGYPTLSFLPPNVAKDDVGVQLSNDRTVPALRSAVVQYLAAQQAAGNGSASWVNLFPFSGSREELFSSADRGLSDGVVLVGTKDNTLAQEIIMDMGYFKEDIVLRWATRDSGFLSELSLPAPSLLPVPVLVHRGHQPQVLQNDFSSAADVRKEIIEALGLDVNKLPSYKPSVEETGTADEVVGAADGSDDSEGEQDEPSVTDQVYLVDVENAVGIALRQEVGLHKTIAGERLVALKNFLAVLAKYLPARPRVHAYLSDLSKSVSKFESPATYDEYAAAMQRADQHGVLPLEQPWVGCKGSEPHLRGFPCGLWTTFHLLTVNAATIAASNDLADPLETLSAIHEFVKYFFSCSHCSEHFQEMYAKDAVNYVTSHDASILWLWKSHNNVNQRIAGAPSEDPHHPKVQYPTRAACPRCRSRAGSGSTFKQRVVLTYLKKVYSKDALSQESVSRPNSQDMESRRMGKSFDEDSRQLAGLRDAHSDSRHMVKVLDDNDDDPQNSSLFRDLGEISTCMILYSVSALGLALAYFIYLMRKRIRRKKFIEMYKNP
ncbi:Thioredoxin domain [Trinorchestia longiramus]|nr:Thioredoxin domain [Trinorchestia longiramus]